MIYQHSISMNKIVSTAKRQKFNRDFLWKVRNWGRNHINFVRLSLSNKYIVSLCITQYQMFFLPVWIYFGLVTVAWAISLIVYPIIWAFNKILNISCISKRV